MDPVPPISALVPLADRCRRCGRCGRARVVSEGAALACACGDEDRPAPAAIGLTLDDAQTLIERLLRDRWGGTFHFLLSGTSERGYHAGAFSQDGGEHIPSKPGAWHPTMSDALAAFLDALRATCRTPKKKPPTDLAERARATMRERGDLVLRALWDGETRTAADLVEPTGLTKEQIRKVLQWLLDAGHVAHVPAEDGARYPIAGWRISTPTPASPRSST